MYMLGRDIHFLRVIFLVRSPRDFVLRMLAGIMSLIPSSLSWISSTRGQRRKVSKAVILVNAKFFKLLVFFVASSSIFIVRISWTEFSRMTMWKKRTKTEPMAMDVNEMFYIMWDYYNNCTTVGLYCKWINFWTNSELDVISGINLTSFTPSKCEPCYDEYGDIGSHRKSIPK